MTAPVWMNAVIGDFGRAAGLNGLALNERGAAALKFEDGTALRLEYADNALVVAMTVPSADVKRLLSRAFASKGPLRLPHPDRAASEDARGGHGGAACGTRRDAPARQRGV